MPKSKKGSSRDLLDKVKKVSAAGRGGDTRLAHLSPMAQKILKGAGGAGTRNPKTGLKEFKAAAEMGRRAAAELEDEGEARRSLAEFEAARNQAMAQMAPPVAEPEMERAAVQPEAEPVAPPPAFTPSVEVPPPRTAREEFEAITQPQAAAPPPAVEPPQAAAPGSAAADLQQITNPTAPPPAAAAPPPAAPATGSAAVDMAELDRIAQGFRDAGMGNTGVDVSGLAPGSLTTPTGQVNAQFFDPNMDMSGIPNVDPSTLSPGQQGTTPPPGSAAADLQQITNPAALPTAAPPVEQPPLFDDDMTPAQRRAAARRDEDLFRPPQMTPGRDMPSQPPPSQPPPSQPSPVQPQPIQPPVTQPPPAQPPPPPPPPPPSQPPPTQPPPAQPPITQPPGPVTQPPVTQPPVTQPPVTQPPVTQLPVTPPPVAIPPGLINSPLPQPPAQPPAQPPDTGGIQPLPPGTLPQPPAQPPVPPSRGGGGFNFGNFFGEDTDIGRLIGRIGGGRGGGGRGGKVPGGEKIPELPPTGGGLPARPELPPIVGTPQPPGGGTAPPVVGPPAYTPPPPIRMPSTPLPPPLPTPIGAGTPTPYFNPNAGGLTPGTVPTGRTPSSLATSNVPLQALAQNPNLGPTMLGGAQNAGYYTDRFGNMILSPGAVKPPGRKKGGPSNEAELLRLMQEFGSADKDGMKGLKQLDSARAMLDELSSEGPRTELSFDETPISQSVRRTSRAPIRRDTDRGSARGMAMELEEVTKTQGPRTKAQVEDVRQRMELLRNTLGMPTFSKATLAREGELMAKRFAEGGEAESSWLPLQTRTYLESVIGSDKKTAPLTEKSFSAKELAKLRELIALAEERPVSSRKTGKPLPGIVSYAHHTEQIRRNNPETGLPLEIVDSDFNPAESANLRNTLGTFSFKRMPDGSIVVKDAYDYTGDIAEEGNPLIKFANWRGVNRPVNIRIPPVKRAKGSPKEGETTDKFIRRLEEYSPYTLMERAAEGLRNQVTGLVELPGAVADFGRGALQKIRELSPEELRGSAPAMDTQSVDAFIAAAQRAKEDPRGEAAKALASMGNYVKEGVSSPGNFAQMLGENVPLPGPRTGATPRTQVVRPRGEGVVLDYPDAPLVSLKNKDKTLDEAYGTNRLPKGYISRAIDRGKDAIEGNVTVEDVAKREAITDFLETKVRKYFANQYGTKDDPIFNAIKEGRLSTVGLGGPEGIREYLPKAAREGKTRINPETGKEVFYPSSSAKAALEDMSRIYDKMTGLQGTVFVDRTVGSPQYEGVPLDIEERMAAELKQQTTQRLIDEGVSPYEINARLSLMGYKDPKFTEKLPPGQRLVSTGYSHPSEDIRALFLANREALPKSLRTAIEKGQPIYDIDPRAPLSSLLDTKYLVEHLASLPVKDIKSLRFEDAIKGSAKARDRIESREALVARIRNGQPVDNKVFLQGVSEPLMKYDADSSLPGFTWRRIEDPEATAVEGAYIGHSVGGYAKGGGYGPESHARFVEGKNKVYTLRDARGRPVTTVEVKEIEGRGPVVSQVKGAGNKSGNVQTPHDSALIDLFNKLGIVGVTESDSYLPPLALAYKKQPEAQRATRVQMRGRLGAPQPIGRLAPEEPPVPQQVPAAPMQQAPVQPGPDQLPPEIEQRLRRGGADQRMLNLLGMLRRRMMEDDDRGPEAEE